MFSNVLRMRSPDLMVSGPQIKQWRELRGLTQEQLADRLGIARPTLANWESTDPRRQPTATNFKALCRVLRVKASELLVVSDDTAA